MRIGPIRISRPASAMLAIIGLLVALGALMRLADATVAKPPTQLQVSTDPSLFPSFDQSVSDYVVRCQPSNEVQVSVAAPSQTKVSVDGGRRRGGSFTQTVSLSEGQSFQIVFYRAQADEEVLHSMPAVGLPDVHRHAHRADAGRVVCGRAQHIGRCPARGIATLHSVLRQQRRAGVVDAFHWYSLATSSYCAQMGTSLTHRLRAMRRSVGWMARSCAR